MLITGESGTGKGRLARFIHERSRRIGGPFVAINCGALPETLLENELFGHTKGAFTGAVDDRKGLFESGTGGTLFLDEIGETTPGMQVRLLRALQERVVRPVGATRDIDIDVRVLAATNRDLKSMVAEGTFRKDLYYRLSIVPLDLPPLRDRREDLLPLALELIAQTCHDNHCGPCSLSSEVIDMFLTYDWPGNIRELENAIERSVILAEGQPRIEVGDLPPEVLGVQPQPPPASGEILTLAEVKHRHIMATLEKLNGNRKATAKALGIGENTLWRHLKSYGLVHERSHNNKTSRSGT